MTAPTVRTDHEKLQSIAQSFSTQADNINKVNQQVKSRLSTLQSGDWKGKGATAFYQEMSDQVLPTMQRLNNALAQASQITKQISAIMKEAESEASKCFHL
jgi:WXG100 family type VII secretion target